MGSSQSAVRSSASSTCEFGGLCEEISGKPKSILDGNIAEKDTSSQIEDKSEEIKSVLNVENADRGLESKNVAKGDGAKFEGFKSNDDLYPERQEGGKFMKTWFQTLVLGEGTSAIDKTRCELNVMNCIEKYPLLKLMLSALKSSGCEVDLKRHISCECCSKKVTGGYDVKMNQIVVCQNVARNEEQVVGALAHELVHMFDYCRAKLDLTNVDHLACTEIRAANLMHCSFMSAMFDGSASPINVSQRHKECVKQKALLSVMAVRDMSKEDALAAVERVFQKCYNDLEPLGRRLRRNSKDIEKCYREKYHYGYLD